MVFLLKDLLPATIAMINPINLYVWELNETTGKLEQLPKSENGLIATDDDCLNLKLYEINEMYGELLELQQKHKNNGR